MLLCVYSYEKEEDALVGGERVVVIYIVNHIIIVYIRIGFIGIVVLRFYLCELGFLHITHNNTQNTSDKHSNTLA